MIDPEIFDQVRRLRTYDEAYEMYEIVPRLLIVTDGRAWFVRHVRVVERGMDWGEQVYRCDAPVGGRFESLDEATAFVRTVYESLSAERGTS
jgi:hypothetical protein